ncbi:MAG TPA: endonuclease/exonuclease/phosphatase family protein [Steroidobacteraceae bacterium]|nr:endonuclease/exonuclease/phosphatase family protein [Steroidobacteraceae bacterium]
MLALTGADARALRGLALRVGLICCALASVGASAPEAPRNPTLKIATWNLEWLIAPSTFKPLKSSCVPRGVQAFANERRLPCDVAQRLERSSRDFAMLARYARTLDADVIALQEVDGPEAARLVFPGYEFCFTGSRHLQNTGFAIRAGLPMRCGPDFEPLSLDDTLRRGAELVLFPGQPREIHLLSVHLKSGCSDKPLAGGGDKACDTLARQVPALERWIDGQARAGHRFAVLGDFNRELLGERGPVRMWSEMSDGDPPGAHLLNVAQGQPFRNCVPGQAHAAFIDHIVLGGALAGALVPGSFERVTYSAADARHARLSDHCPVAVRLAIGQIARPESR